MGAGLAGFGGRTRRYVTSRLSVFERRAAFGAADDVREDGTEAVLTKPPAGLPVILVPIAQTPTNSAST